MLGPLEAFGVHSRVLAAVKRSLDLSPSFVPASFAWVR